jgi:hypothetical protein
MNKVALNIPDTHVPWHDPKAWNILLTIAQDVHEKYGIDEINILGDFLDFFWVSLHPKLPDAMSIKETFQDEVAQGCKMLMELRKMFPGVKINFLEGNHEFRLMRYIVKNCPALWDLPELKLEYVLKLDELDINLYPFGKKQLYRCFGDSEYVLRHQPFNGGKHCAASSLRKKVSIGFGHTHRKQTFTETDAFGKEFQARSLGWLGDRNAPVFSYMDHDDWCQGFEFAWQISGEMHYQYVEIKEGKAIYEGTVYEF